MRLALRRGWCRFGSTPLYFGRKVRTDKDLSIKFNLRELHHYGGVHFSLSREARFWGCFFSSFSGQLDGS